jgi:hypothetical protein
MTPSQPSTKSRPTRTHLLHEDPFDRSAPQELLSSKVSAKNDGEVTLLCYVAERSPGRGISIRRKRRDGESDPELIHKE